MTKQKTLSTGPTVLTRNALETVHPEDVTAALGKHASGDWGECGEEDWQSNELAYESGEDRIFSIYWDRNGVKFWIITEWDRSSTTVLLPEDY